jgi:hypothetical protein
LRVQDVLAPVGADHLDRRARVEGKVDDHGTVAHPSPEAVNGHDACAYEPGALVQTPGGWVPHRPEALAQRANANRAGAQHQRLVVDADVGPAL